MMQTLLAKGAEVNARISHTSIPSQTMWDNRALHYGLGPGGTPLQAAAAAAVGGQPGAVELLIARGAEVDAADNLGRTSLHLAAERGHDDIIELLIGKGANVNARDNREATPLVGALMTGKVEAAKVLIAHGAMAVDVRKHTFEAIEGRPYKRGELLRLHDIIPNGRIQWIELLLANGADPNERDDMANTPLQAAILQGNEGLARLFIAHGTDVNAGNQSNITALHYAAREGWAELTSLLLAKGSLVNTRDNHGDTPLHYATRQGRGEVVEVLLAGGADVSIKDSRGRTPQDEAARRGHKDIVQLLTAKTKSSSSGFRDSATKQR